MTAPCDCGCDRQIQQDVRIAAKAHATRCGWCGDQDVAERDDVGVLCCSHCAPGG